MSKRTRLKHRPNRFADINRELDHTVLLLHVENTQKDEKIVQLNQLIDEQNEKINELLAIQKNLEESNAAKV